MNIHRILSRAALFASAAGTTLTLASLPAAEPPRIAWIDLEGSPKDRPSELAWLMGSVEPTLRETIEALRALATDAECRGAVIRLKDAELTPAQVEEIGAAIASVRKAGKKVHIFSESYGNTGLMLAAHADEVILQSGGEVSMPGLYMEEMFLADTLAWAGVKADFVQIGDFKGAAEQLARSAPSEAWEENINQLLDQMYTRLREPIMKGRNLTGEQLDKAMLAAWMADGSEAIKAGLIDSQVDLPRLSAHLGEEYGGSVTISKREIGSKGTSVDATNPFAMMAALTKEPKHKPTKPTIAVLHIDGQIVDGDSSAGFGGQSVGSRTIRNALEDILAEDLIKGVVVRIDSPGGSAVASEIMWQGVRRVAEKKPVWVSVGGMAASGGYYLAVAGDRVYVNPSSIVGSIGVVGGKLAMQGLYDKLKMNVVGRGRGPRAAMLDSSQPWNAEDRALVAGKMKGTYDLFARRVTAGRKGIDLSRTAEGRLFTGTVAIDLKMADKIGGLEVALADMADSLSLKDYAVMDYPGPKSLSEVLEDALSGFIAAPAVASPPMTEQMFGVAREALGPRAWKQLSPQLKALLTLRDEPVILVAPRALIWK